MLRVQTQPSSTKSPDTTSTNPLSTGVCPPTPPYEPLDEAQLDSVSSSQRRQAGLFLHFKDANEPTSSDFIAESLQQPSNMEFDQAAAEDEDETHSWEDEVFEEEQGVLSASEAIAELEVIDKRARQELELMEREQDVTAMSGTLPNSGELGDELFDNAPNFSTLTLGAFEGMVGPVPGSTLTLEEPNLIPPSERSPILPDPLIVRKITSGDIAFDVAVGRDLRHNPHLLIETDNTLGVTTSLLPGVVGAASHTCSKTSSVPLEATTPFPLDDKSQPTLRETNPQCNVSPVASSIPVPSPSLGAPRQPPIRKPPVSGSPENRNGESTAHLPISGLAVMRKTLPSTAISFNLPKPPAPIGHSPPSPVSTGTSPGGSSELSTSPGNRLPRHPRLTSFSVSYAAATQQGYRRMNGNVRKPLHDQMEDVHWPCPPAAPGSCLLGGGATGTPSSASPEPSTRLSARTHRYGPIMHPISNFPIHIYILADGHGGVQAPRYFVRRLAELASSTITSKDWEFDLPDQRTEFAEVIRKIFGELDHDYCEAKKQEYRTWQSGGPSSAESLSSKSVSASASGAAGTTPTIPTTQPHTTPLTSAQNGSGGTTTPRKKPVDDGCTLVLNVLYNGYLVNCNVGDSRTVLGRRPTAANSTEHARFHSEWSVCFASVDHSPAHPEKALHIHKNGGLFINDNGTRRHVKIDERRKKPYADLVGARILRPLDDNIKAVGVSHLRTLNLASTMGDLLYKIHPPILSSVPDVSFIRLTPGYDYVLTIGTDGVWDHLRMINSPEGQNRAVVSFVGREWDSWLRQGGSKELEREERKYTEPESQSANGGSSFKDSASEQSLNSDAEHVRCTVDVPSDTESDTTVSELQREESPGSAKGKSVAQSNDADTSDDENSTIDANGLHVHGRGAGKRGLELIAKMLTDREHTPEMFFPGFVRVDDVTMFLVVIVDKST
ncbi:protein serine/threonine phosphatase 2C [Gonapodya prolifera JEL478]|uniref:Protein serine/threonine phosphatase 2C n=1 Tax=Gonapodya prolifera (strain JEL478) TaxID=1344416 RepID=A0A139A9K3_GONPJ|nr:protein serine/threonine phosphatase 2C [Gonapodya prolifera JEL478]|eukprot:KXS13480.1 protein serine/threonine phosphatase 2C [Gonapodya prolifera JEL478]